MVKILRKCLAEFAGTAILVCVVVGSGIMGTNLSDNPGIALLINTFSTIFALALLILAIIASRVSRRARRKIAMNARPEVYVTYQPTSDVTVSAPVGSTDPWDPPRPEDRAGQ